MKTIDERLLAIADKAAAKAVDKASILAAHKPASGKKLTTDQRLSRIEALLGIVDEAK